MWNNQDGEPELGWPHFATWWAKLIVRKFDCYFCGDGSFDFKQEENGKSYRGTDTGVLNLVYDHLFMTIFAFASAIVCTPLR